MTKDDITRMAREAGFVGFDGENKCLREFAALVVAAEREACAKVCDSWYDVLCQFDSQRRTHHYIMGKGAAMCAHNIRARGTVPTSVIYSPGDLAARGLTHEDVVKLIKENT